MSAKDSASVTEPSGENIMQQRLSERKKMKVFSKNVS